MREHTQGERHFPLVFLQSMSCNSHYGPTIVMIVSVKVAVIGRLDFNIIIKKNSEHLGKLTIGDRTLSPALGPNGIKQVAVRQWEENLHINRFIFCNKSVTFYSRGKITMLCENSECSLVHHCRVHVFRLFKSLPCQHTILFMQSWIYRVLGTWEFLVPSPHFGQIHSYWRGGTRFT